MRFRIATFNLENLDHRPGQEPSLEKRIEALRPALARLDADILCLQEVNAQGNKERTLEALDTLLDGTPYADFSRAATESDTGKPLRDVQNLVTLSRFPIAAQQQYRHDFVPPPAYDLVTAEASRQPARGEISWDRPVLHTRHSLESRPGSSVPADLHVVNVHFRAPLAAHIAGKKTSAYCWMDTASWAEGFFVASLKRNAQALETRLVVERLFEADSEALIAVCGDFNSADREVPVATLRADVEDTGNPYLGGRALITLDNAIPDHLRYTVIHGGRRVMMDHILGSRTLANRLDRIAAHNELLEDELIAYLMDVHPAGSFHAPLLAEFNLSD